MNNTIEKLTKCIAACNKCHDACLGEDDIKSMAECIRLDKDCAQVCSLTLNLIYRESPFLKKAAQFCITVCNACKEECAKYDSMDHCRQCAEACDECIQACQALNN